MVWRPGPAIDEDITFSDHDERDPWIKRFISRTDDGQLSLDVEAMNGIERAAGTIFTELIRHQAERRPQITKGCAWSSRMLERRGGIATSRRGKQLPAPEEESPTAQYEPFRCTFLDDPRYTPQLRFANVSDSGADHHERETDRHWRRAGRTWSKVPRFRSDRTVFAYDPSYKPSHAIVDKWYMTEAGPKASLMVRVRESRWQSCHSRQTGRLRKKTMRPRVQPRPEKSTPGPTHYRLRDPWEVKEVCGVIPPSRVFCPPVQRVRPRTTEFSCAFPVTGLTNRQNSDPRPLRHAASAAAAGVGSNFSDPMRRKSRRHRQAATAAAFIVPANASDASAVYLTSDVSPGRSERSSPSGPSAFAVARVSPGKVQRSHAPVGPLSFARAERPSFTDEITKREDNYGKRAVRLMTNRGDMLVTVSRRTNSACEGSSGRPTSRINTQYASVYWSSVGSDAQASIQPGENPRLASTVAPPRKRPSPAAAVAREEGSRGGPTSTPSITSPGVPGGQGWCAGGDSTLEALAARILPEDLASTLPDYREPGRAELPAIFCAKPAPLVKFYTVGAEVSPPLCSSAKTRKGGMLTNPEDARDGCSMSGGGVAPWTEAVEHKAGRRPE